MGQREKGGRDAAGAQRLRQLRVALGYPNAAAFAAHLRIDYRRWNNFENGYPLSKDAAIHLVQVVPGLTLDWLYLGKPDGLPYELATRLVSPPATRRKSG